VACTRPCPCAFAHKNERFRLTIERHFEVPCRQVFESLSFFPNLDSGFRMSLREQRRAHTIELILEAASRAFGDQGFYSTSMEDIAQEAGCGTGTLYGYFSGKAEIFSRLVSDLTERFLQGADAAVDEAEDFDSALSGYLAVFQDMALKDGTVLGLLLSMFQSHEVDALPDAEVMRRADERHIALLTRLMQQGIKEGVLRKMEPQLPALALMGIIHSFIFGWLGGLFGEDPAAAINTCTQLFLDGARARGETQ